jgi:hypothetical protein
VTTGQLGAPAADRDTRHRNWREGARAGLFAAAVGALWSMLVDLVAGHPFKTWYFLGSSLLDLPGAEASRRPIVAMFVFLAFVAAVFMLVGRLGVAVAHRSNVQPGLILFTNMIVTLVTLALLGVAAAFTTSRLGGEAWLQILGSPLIALWTLAIRLYLTHPSVARDFQHADD